MRGKYGIYPQTVKGVTIDETKTKKRAHPKGMCWYALAHCHDCGHEWWTTHLDRKLTLREFEQRFEAKAASVKA